MKYIKWFSQIRESLDYNEWVLTLEEIAIEIIQDHGFEVSVDLFNYSGFGGGSGAIKDKVIVTIEKTSMNSSRGEIMIANINDKNAYDEFKIRCERYMLSEGFKLSTRYNLPFINPVVPHKYLPDEN